MHCIASTPWANEQGVQALSTDVKFPCYEVTIDQTLYQNAWVQLTLNSDPATQWNFVKGKGYVTVVASNLTAAEFLNVAALRFENQTIVIGKNYQGGIIFYIDGTGEHGLVAASVDQSTGIQWYNGTYLNPPTKTAVGTGAANTTEIVNVQGAGNYAAQLTADLVRGGYDDWFLPSLDELSLMYHNIGQGAAMPLTNIGGFAAANYWSSSDAPNGTAAMVRFSDGFGDYLYQANMFYVRAVRAF